MTKLGDWDPLLPDEVSTLLVGLDCRWWLSGGWSLDSLIGTKTRPHGDTDVTVLRADVLTVRQHFCNWDLYVADPPGTLTPWPVGTALATDLHDVWCRQSESEPWRLQLMINDVVSGQWVYRRDSRIQRSLESLAGRASTKAIPIIAPEIQLLYKSTHLRMRDKADFERVLPYLKGKERRWLRESLLITAPEHPWISRLSD